LESKSKEKRVEKLNYLSELEVELRERLAAEEDGG